MIVKNCPAYYSNLGCMSNKMFFRDCENDDTCIIKEIVQRLKQNNNYNDILKKLEIEC